MTNTIRISKRSRLLVLILAAAVISFAVYHLVQKHQAGVKPRIETIKVPGGWGYRIFLGDRLFIEQPFIPVLPGKNPFPDRKSALKTAKTVRTKLLQGKRPDLTTRDIMDAGIDTLGISD
jgi:Domain of unknown function (DUF4907)